MIIGKAGQLIKSKSVFLSYNTKASQTETNYDPLYLGRGTSHGLNALINSNEPSLSKPSQRLESDTRYGIRAIPNHIVSTLMEVEVTGDVI
jgi:hypothetical protein